MIWIDYERGSGDRTLGWRSRVIGCICRIAHDPGEQGLSRSPGRFHPCRPGVAEPLLEGPQQGRADAVVVGVGHPVANMSPPEIRDGRDQLLDAVQGADNDGEDVDELFALGLEIDSGEEIARARIDPEQAAVKQARRDVGERRQAPFKGLKRPVEPAGPRPRTSASDPRPRRPGSASLGGGVGDRSRGSP